MTTRIIATVNGSEGKTTLRLNGRPPYGDFETGHKVPDAAISITCYPHIRIEVSVDEAERMAFALLGLVAEMKPRAE